jgi:hypothetical protein
MSKGGQCAKRWTNQPHRGCIATSNPNHQGIWQGWLLLQRHKKVANDTPNTMVLTANSHTVLSKEGK